MTNLQSIVSNHFTNLEYCKIFDVEKYQIDNAIVNKNTNIWINWFINNALEINFLRIKLQDNSDLIFKRLSDSQHLVIHNYQENTATLLSFLKTLGVKASDPTTEDETIISNTSNNENIDLKMLDAQRIQQLIIPSTEKLRSSFKSFFVLHQQQDLVGGDFYWYYKLGNAVLLALVDCTGHSIEGAMTSMICNSLLNQSMVDFDENDLSKFVRKFYEQMESYNETTRDMMDYGIGAEIGIFLFNNQDRRARFCSTGISAYLRKESGLELIKSKKCIDYSKLRVTDQAIDLSETEGIYFFTDGLTDQFNSQDNKKLGYKGVETMITEEKAFDTAYYKNALNNWKGDNIQYDDITMIGIAV